MNAIRPLRVLVLLVLLGLLPVALTQSSTSGQNPDGTSEAEILTPEEAFEMMAEWYSVHFGVSMDEARRALILQEDAGELSSTLLEQEAGFVVEVRAEHTPAFHVVVLIAPGGEDRVLTYTEGSPLEGLVVVETVPWTQEQLDSDLVIASLMAQEVGVPVSSDTHGGRAYLYTPDAEELERRLKDAGLELPKSVIIEEAPMPQDPEN